MKITVDQIMSWGPCEEYTLSRLEKLVGDGLTPEQVAALDIPLVDRLWVLFCAMSERQQCEAACQFAERVLPIFEKVNPDDTRPREAIEAARAYARGEIDDAARAAARAAAGDAAWDAARSAARSAAGAAAWDAAGDAAGDAAVDAAWAAETEAQVQIMLKILAENAS